MDTAQNKTQTTGEAAPSGIVGTFGLKADVFAAQLVNFLIILFVLWRWAYKPIIKILEEREVTIKKGLSDAEAAAVRLSKIEEEHSAVLAAARKEGAEFMKEAHGIAEKKRDELIQKSKDEIGKLITEARKKISDERETAKEELKKEIAALVVATAELVLKEKLDSGKDATLMEHVTKKAPKKKEHHAE